MKSTLQHIAAVAIARGIERLAAILHRRSTDYAGSAMLLAYFQQQAEARLFSWYKHRLYGHPR